MDKDPQIKKTEDFQLKTANPQSRTKDFPWDSDLDNETETQALKYNSDDVDHCVEALTVALLKAIAPEHFAGRKECMVFEVPIDLEIHPLLEKRFSEDWSLDSRVQMFDIVKDQLVAQFGDEMYSFRLNEKIKSILPPASQTYELSQIILHDNALSIGSEVNTVSIEVKLRSIPMKK